jgi:hypothetical protein
VNWTRVSYPSDRVFYHIYHWKITAGQTEANAVHYGPIPFDSTGALLQFAPGDGVAFRVRAENIGGMSPPSNIATAFAN